MKILHVITSLLTGGAETLLVNLIPRLRAMGNEVDVCVFLDRKTPLMNRLEQENKGIRIWKLGNGFYNPTYIFKLIKIMRGYDIVHTHNSSPQLYAAIASLFTHVHLCTTEHSTENRKRNFKLFKPIDSWMYNRYDQIICISDIAKQKLCNYLGGKWNNPNGKKYGKISVVNNGVDVESIHNAKPLDESVALRKGKFIITMVAGFREAKDQDTVVRSLRHLPKEYNLWLVGDGVRINTVKELAKALAVDDRVRFWGIRNDVPRILRTSDVVVMSSHWEGLSLSNIEGMSAGKPFIASDVNGLREVTKGYGILFPEGNDTILATELRRLHDNKNYYKDIADHCFKRAQMFDIKNTAEGYNRIYKQITGDEQA